MKRCGGSEAADGPEPAPPRLPACNWVSWPSAAPLPLVAGLACGGGSAHAEAGLAELVLGLG